MTDLQHSLFSTVIKWFIHAGRITRASVSLAACSRCSNWRDVMVDSEDAVTPCRKPAMANSTARSEVTMHRAVTEQMRPKPVT